MSAIVDISGALLKFTDNRNARLGLSAFILSFLVVLTMTAITSVSYDANEGFRFSPKDNLKLALAVSLVILFVASWFILYLLGAKDATDVYSEVREAISGAWVVSYEAAVGPKTQTIARPRQNTYCKIDINPEKKLFIKFEDEGGEFFKPGSPQIREVAIRYGEDDGYTMFYYCKMERQLSDLVTNLIAPGYDGRRISEIEIEFFGRVSFTKSRNEERITKMGGNWYDLNGNASRLITLLDSKRVADIKGEQFCAMSLDKVPIHQSNFDADMGPVEFRR